MVIFVLGLFWFKKCANIDMPTKNVNDVSVYIYKFKYVYIYIYLYVYTYMRVCMNIGIISHMYLNHV